MPPPLTSPSRPSRSSTIPRNGVRQSPRRGKHYIDDATYPDRDVLELKSPPGLSNADIEDYLKAVSHMRTETALRILAYNEYDVDKSVSFCENRVEPKLMSTTERQVFAAAFPVQRMLERQKKEDYSRFVPAPLDRLFPAQKSSTLVQYYYDNKTKLNQDSSSDSSSHESIPRRRRKVRESSDDIMQDASDIPSTSRQRNSPTLSERTDVSSLFDRPSSRRGRNSQLAKISTASRDRSISGVDEQTSSSRRRPVLPSIDIPSVSTPGPSPDLVASPLKRVFTFDVEEIVVLKFCLRRFGLDFEKIADVMNKPCEEIKSYAELSNYFGIFSP